MSSDLIGREFDVRERIARIALSHMGYKFEGESLCDEAERVITPGNPRAVRAVAFADEVLAALADTGEMPDDE